MVSESNGGLWVPFCVVKEPQTVALDLQKFGVVCTCFKVLGSCQNTSYQVAVTSLSLLKLLTRVLKVSEIE